MKNARNKIASRIAKLEGKKVQVPIGNIREVLKLLVLMQAEALEHGILGPLTELSAEAAELTTRAVIKRIGKPRVVRARAPK